MAFRIGSTDHELLELISTARSGVLDTEGIASLARDLADSGETVALRRDDTADVASTGGPSSLSTLLCPLFLKTLGWIVPKLGVPGRPAGGLDVLSQIPGYKVHLSAIEVARVLAECGYAHFAAGNRIAPLDARLFALRQRTGAQGIPSLVIASLLSKKLAVGVRYAGLDIRVAKHGNFGSDMPTARENARAFCQVASKLDIRATCLLSDASRPYQPYIGRGEALLALSQLWKGVASPWLNRHADQCIWMACASVGKAPTPTDRKAAYDAFTSNIKAQGGTVDGFEGVVDEVTEGHKYAVTAPNSGFPIVDLERLRRLMVSLQGEASVDNPYPDPVGVIILAEDTQIVASGDAIMSVRAKCMTTDLMKELAACLTVSSNPSFAILEKSDG